MRVRQLMTPSPLTIEGDQPVLEAIRLMHDHAIHELPVVEGGRLVGILTDRDVRMFLGPEVYRFGEEPAAPDGDALFPVGAVMTPHVITVHGEATVASAARLLAEARVGSLPVVDTAGRLVGILSVTDILRACADWLDDLVELDRVPA